ncbi:MAG: glycosyltransferase family 39 protein [Candidatus Limnocylindrales bacterium]
MSSRTTRGTGDRTAHPIADPSALTVDRAPLPPVAWTVLAVAGVVVAVLLVLAPAYGFHRDELYFILAGRHPDFGYVDQPPLTPILSALAVSLFGLQPLSLRVLPALCVGACIVVTALLAREARGGRAAQVLAAVTAGVSGYLAAGHLDVTATYDLLVWALLLLLSAKILLGSGGGRLWVLVGVVAGIGLENKQTSLFLLAGLVVAILLERRDLVRTRWPWVAGLIALAVWAPNLWWQAAHGFPQLEMARSIAGDATKNRVLFLPQLLLVAGPFTFPVAVAGLVRLLRGPDIRPLRPLGTAAVVVLLLVFASGGKSYYAVGSLPILLGAGAVSLVRWLGRSGGGLSWRSALLSAATVGTAVVIAVLALPVLPPATLARTPIPDIYPENAEQVGWHTLARDVDGVVATLPAQRRATAIVLTANYGEAGAVALLGSSGLPVYSGHNSLWTWGPPPPDADTVVLVGRWSSPSWNGVLSACQTAAVVDNGLGLANQEQGAPIAVCRADGQLWSGAWPMFRHYN